MRATYVNRKEITAGIPLQMVEFHFQSARAGARTPACALAGVLAGGLCVVVLLGSVPHGFPEGLELSLELVEVPNLESSVVDVAGGAEADEVVVGLGALDE